MNNSALTELYINHELSSNDSCNIHSSGTDQELNERSAYSTKTDFYTVKVRIDLGCWHTKVEIREATSFAEWELQVRKEKRNDETR